jgi:hypothetical protein
MGMNVGNVGYKPNVVGIKNQNEKNEAIKLASDFLGTVRKGAEKGDVKLEIDIIRENIAKSGKSFKDIGSSEKELGELLVKGYKNEALKWVSLAKQRAGTGDVSWEVGQVRKYAKLAGKSMSDFDALKQIGTAEWELSGLVEKGNESEAFKWLHLAESRSKTKDVTHELDYFQDYMAKTDKPMEYFASVDDIVRLRQTGKDNVSLAGLLGVFKEIPPLANVIHTLFY